MQRSHQTYDYIWDFEDGIAKIKLNGKFGFIDITGNEVVAPIYDTIRNFLERSPNADTFVKFIYTTAYDISS